jgi:hypothetical protein
VTIPTPTSLLTKLDEGTLFDLLKMKMIEDLTMSSTLHSEFDCYSRKHRVLIELKCRKVHYDTLLVEQGKYIDVISKASRLGYRPIYINSTPEGIWAFDLSKVERTAWKHQMMPSYTEIANNSYPARKVAKTVAYLHVDDAISLAQRLA